MFRPMLSRCLLAGSLGLYVFLFPPLSALAQRASGTSAGAASGFNNNSSATTPIGVPTFDDWYIDLDAKNDISVKNLATNAKATVSTLEDVQSFLPAADSFWISSARYNTFGTVRIKITGSRAIFTVETLGAAAFVSVPVASINDVKLFLAAMVLAGVKSSTSYLSGSELVVLGVPPIQAAKLLAALSRLDGANNLNQLARSIEIFNSIVNDVFASNSVVLEALASNPAFLAIRETLREGAAPMKLPAK